MKSVSALISSALLAALVAAPFAGCGKKEKKVEVVQDPSNLGNQKPVDQTPPPVQIQEPTWPQAIVKDANNLGAGVKDGKVTITWQLQGSNYQSFDYLCAVATESELSSPQLQPCTTQTSYTASNLQSGQTYVFQLHAVDRASSKRQKLVSEYITLAGGAAEITVVGEDLLKKTFAGLVNLTFQTSQDEVTYRCGTIALVGQSQLKELSCRDGKLALNVSNFVGQHNLIIAAYDANVQDKVVANKTVGFCGGAQCAYTNPGGGSIPGGGTTNPGGGSIPGGGIPGMPGTGGVGGIPGGPVFPGGGAGPIVRGPVSVMLGAFWSVTIPARFHILSYSADRTLTGANVTELVEVMDDVMARVPSCDPFNTAFQLITLPDGDGYPRQYCRRTFRTVEGTDGDNNDPVTRDESFNHVEFSSPAEDLATYERYIFSNVEGGAWDEDSLAGEDEQTNESGPTTRLEVLCRHAFNKGALTMNVINNFWNDPMGPKPAKVRFCQTLVAGPYGQAMEVWVAGFYYAQHDSGLGSENPGTTANLLEMAYVSTPIAAGTNFNTVTFMSKAALQIRAMLLQTGLNAPFEDFEGF